MVKFIPSNATKILDIGCGEGNFGSILKVKNNLEIWGIEKRKDIAEYAKAKLDYVITGDFEIENLTIPQDYFDCIVFNDILEHFKYPWNVLEKIRPNLTDGGYIITSIPNIRYFYVIKDLVLHKKFAYSVDGVLDREHLRFFTVRSIVDMFLSCNYQIINLEGINAIKFPWKFRLFNWILKDKFNDTKYRQFAIVAQKK
jgi:2-polyprenyl-3-methyl-5-hydroxy-6-metoxy-1,4-benzoquinol methylase